MKNFFLMLLFIVAVTSVNATVHTVSNNTFSPGQSTSLQNTLDSASNGDTIYVEPSPYDYGAITIQKQVYLFGGGSVPYTYQFNYNTQVDNVTFSVATQYSNIVSTPNGSIIQGFYLAYPEQIIVSAGLKNITVARDYLDYGVVINGPDTNIVVINNMFNQYGMNNINGNNPNDITALIANNFFNQSNNGGTSCRITGNNVAENGIIVANNIFYGNSSNASNQGTFFAAVDYMTVKNNIYYCDGGVAQTFQSGCSNCSFLNNITYSPSTGNNQNLPDAGNSGSGNINNQNPQFAGGPGTYTNINTGQLYDYNWTLTAGSPGHLAGTDGTDIGIFGGAYPMPGFEGITHLPQVRQLNINNSTVQPNGTLNVNVIGTTHN